MMTVDFIPMEVTTFLHCRRGRNTYRRTRIDIGMHQAIYNALPQTSLEVVDAMGHVWSRGDIQENRGRITLVFQGPPDPAKVEIFNARQEQEAKKEAEANDKGTTTPESDQRPEEKDNDDVQQVGGERHSDGKTIQRSLHVQIPLVGKSDARLERTEKRGTEGGPDGLHSSDDESSILDNRHAARVRSLSSPNEDSGRD